MATSALPRYSRRAHRPPRFGPVERWFLPALLLTAALHFGGFYLLHATRFNGFAAPRDFRPPSRVFQVQQATFDPRTLDPRHHDEPTGEVPAKPVPDVTDIQIPGDAKPSYEQLIKEADTVIAAPDADKTTVTAEKPQVNPSRQLDRLLADSSPQALPSDLKALTDQLLNAKPHVTGSHPSFDVTGATDGSRPNAGPTVGAPNFSNLDGLLSTRGPLTSKTAPILLPTDLLFEYNEAVLRPAAVGSLQKLAELMERNPNATFVIEGHTDNFGTPEYNMQLSLARAESVKAWLVEQAGIEARRIQTRGLGLSRLLVSGGSIEQQKLNRRVEIVIKTNRSAGR